MKSALLPSPRKLEYGSGLLSLPEQPHIVFQQHPLPALLRAVQQPDSFCRDPQSSAVIGVSGRPDESCAVDIMLSHGDRDGAESYRLHIGSDGIDIHGDSPAGLFYGLQTLRQLITRHGRSLPQLTIDDTPAFALRGYYLDISRGKVPALHTLKRIADRLAALKYNHFQLYIEHVFDFHFDPEIGNGCSPLTAAEILELEQYCRTRFIEFIPSIACFGHMGRVLSLPAYRELAEITWSAESWERATWRQRLRGATLDPRKPGSQQLIRNMLNEYLPLFRGGLFNACCDETYDLGRGSNAEFARTHGIGKLFTEHIRFLHEAAQALGKRLMFWGDMPLHHPDAIPDLPADSVVLDWGYSPDTPFEKAGQFIEQGLDTVVCPSVRGYGTVFNEVEEARGNIRGYARAGQRLGAHGMLTTDWGDMGHFNMQGCSLHGIALGGALAWNPQADGSEAFDDAFSMQLFADPAGQAAEIFRTAGNWPLCSWPYLFTGLPEPEKHLKSDRPVTDAMKNTLRHAQDRLGKLQPTALVSAQDLTEMKLGCRALLINTEKYNLTARIRNPAAGSRKDLQQQCRRLAEDIRAFGEDYAAAWLQAYKPSRLNEIQQVLAAIVRETRHWVE